MILRRIKFLQQHAGFYFSLRRGCFSRWCRTAARPSSRVAPLHLPKGAFHSATSIWLGAGPRLRSQPPQSTSDVASDGFVGLAERTIIYAKIKTGFLRFDASLYQWPAALRTGRSKIVDKLEIERIHHGTEQSTLPLVEKRIYSAGQPSQRKLRKCESNQPGAKQDDTCHGHSEKALRSEFITHGTPPVRAPPQADDWQAAQSNVFGPNCHFDAG